MDNRIGEALRNLRMQHNMSQETLAENLSISRQAVSNWENGKTQPDADMLIKISSLFQVSLDEIITNGQPKGLVDKNQKGLIICVASMLLGIIHLSMAVAGKINIIGVIISVLLASIVSLIMYFAFEGSINNNDFSMIAGYKKSDSSNFPRFTKQLRTMSLLVGVLALALNILYVPIYFADRELHMKISMIYMLVFIVGFATSVFTVNYKYKRSE